MRGAVKHSTAHANNKVGFATPGSVGPNPAIGMPIMDTIILGTSNSTGHANIQVPLYTDRTHLRKHDKLQRSAEAWRARFATNLLNLHMWSRGVGVGVAVDALRHIDRARTKQGSPRPG